MEQADKSRFEQEWHDAFENARMTPPDRVWNGIDKSLHGNSWGRKRLFLVQLAMAASVLFAMSIGAAGVYQVFTHQDGSSSVALLDESNDTDIKKGTGDAEATSSDAQTTAGKGSGALPEDEDLLITESSQPGSPNRQAAPLVTIPSNLQDTPGQLVEGSLMSSFAQDIDALDPFGAGLAYTASLPTTHPTGVPYTIIPRRQHRDQVWAALGVSAGSYGSGSGADEMYTLAASADNVNSVQVGRISEETSGSVFQLEMNVGKRISRKWLIQGGVGYMERNSSGSSNIISARGSAVADLSSESFAKMVVAKPYEIENSLQMITVPVQVGYILLDNQVGIRLLTGVANEIMLRHRVEDTDGNLSAQSYSPGDSEEYQAYGLSALFTTEVNYTIAERYQVALRPQLRQSLISVRETDYDLARSLELGFALRYQFE